MWQASKRPAVGCEEKNPVILFAPGAFIVMQQS